MSDVVEGLLKREKEMSAADLIASLMESSGGGVDKYILVAIYEYSIEVLNSEAPEGASESMLKAHTDWQMTAALLCARINAYTREEEE